MRPTPLLQSGRSRLCHRAPRLGQGPCLTLWAAKRVGLVAAHWDASDRQLRSAGIPFVTKKPTSSVVTMKGTGKQVDATVSAEDPIGDQDIVCNLDDCMNEECIAPLRTALKLAQEMLAEITDKRGRLEQEAQEVAQVSVEATRAVGDAQNAVDFLNAEIEAAVLFQKDIEDNVVASLKESKEIGQTVVDEAQSSLLEEVKKQIAALYVELEASKAEYDANVETAIVCDQVAASAMKAAEAAVKEEIQATAVVYETAEALNKTWNACSAEGDALAQGELPPEPAPLFASVDMDGVTSEGPSGASAAADRVTFPSSTETAPPAAEPRKSQRKSTAAVIFILTMAVCVSVGAYTLQYTEGGQQLMAYAQQAFEWVSQKVAEVHVHEGEKSLLEAIMLLMTACVCVPLVVGLIPGGNPVLGYLLGGALVGPYALGIIQDVSTVQHIAELGVVFLLFNIGLELSLDRLRSMAKQVFGMGFLQVALTIVGVVATANALVGLPIPSGIILGGALAMSSTAVGIQVLEDRGEMGSRHGRGIFSVLLFQDLAVVVLLMLIPLLAPSADGSSGGIAVIAKALGLAAVKAVACIVTIIAGGRLVIRPLYKQISELANSELLSSLTLLVCLGTSFLTSLAGLSLALGAFLAGLLIAETEFAMQVESDIAPYKGLLLGLFFMSVGMEISGPLFMARWKEVLVGIVMLVGGKLAIMAAIGPLFGMSKLAAVRAGLLIAPGGEFAFVAFGVAVAAGVLPGPLTSVLYLVVALSMACLPYLAMLGGKLSKVLEQGNSKTKPPDQSETKELKNHVIIAGYGRSGQLIGQLLSENYIPYVAVDTSTDAVAKGKALDLPVYFGDPGSPSVLHHLGAERATCAVIALNSPGANYRVVWALNKYYPKVKTFVRAHDLVAAVNLEKAGATAVVPEILEPSLQLVAAAMSTMNFTSDDLFRVISEYRKRHTKELNMLAKESGTTLGYHGIQPSADPELKKKNGSKKEKAEGGDSKGTAPEPKATSTSSAPVVSAAVA